MSGQTIPVVSSEPGRSVPARSARIRVVELDRGRVIIISDGTVEMTIRLAEDEAAHLSELLGPGRD